jgi:hypothetical protein
MQGVPTFEEAVWSNCGELLPGLTTLLQCMQVDHSVSTQLFNFCWSNNSNYNAPVYARSLPVCFDHFIPLV